ncbi:MAG: hypothetical protein AAB276_03380, partial [Pseudomonadota bacterium]
MTNASKYLKHESDIKKLTIGCISGGLNTILFNPYDRAIYLSVMNKKTIFEKKFWKKPYQGVGQAFIHRTISYGMYFPFLAIWEENLQYLIPKKTEMTLVSNILAGTSVAILTFPIASIKMYTWNNPHRDSIMKIGKELYCKHGKSLFTRGLGTTICRDIIFSSIFGLSTYYFNKE